MRTITNRCTHIFYLAAALLVFTALPADAQNQKNDPNQIENGLIGQLNQLRKANLNQEKLNSALKSISNETRLTTNYPGNDRWSSQFGQAYVQENVVGTEVYDGEIYLMGEISTVSDGEIVTQASGIARWDGESYHAYPGEFNGPVYAVAFIGDDMFVAGGFTSVTTDEEETELNHIARWDGESWTPLGSGTNNEVWTLLAVNNTLYAGGSFTASDGDEVDSPYIARWSETSEEWNSLSGMDLNNSVQIIKTDGSNIYAGGNFDNDGLNHIAIWDGGDWDPLGDGFNSSVFDIELHNDIVYASGAFSERGDGTELRAVGMYDMSEDEADRNWESPGQSSPDNIAYRMSIHNNELYLSGEFQNIGINEIRGVAKLDGDQWQSLGNGIDGVVTSVNHFDGVLHAGGVFTEVDEISSPNFMRFKDNEWQRVGGDTGAGLTLTQLNIFNIIFDAVRYQNDLYVAGAFNEIGGIETTGIVRWDGETWHDVDGGLRVEDGDYDPVASSLLVHDDDLYVAGQFDRAGSLEQPANNIARWDGEEWTRLGSGISESPTGVPYVWNMEEINGSVYVVGDFTDATGVSVFNIAYWDGNDWFDVANGTGSEEDVVRDVHAEGDQLYMVGEFTAVGPSDDLVNANSIAVWSETDQEWSALGNGFAGSDLYTITRFDNELIVGGQLENQGATGDVNGIAAWNSTDEEWEEFRNAGIPVGSTVTNFEIAGEILYLAGVLNSVNQMEDVNSVASYTLDEGWSRLGNGITTFTGEPSLVYKTRIMEEKLWTMGVFTQTGNRSAHGISNWDLQLGVSVENPVTESPDRYQLNQNYPNPFNPVTSIRFELEETAEVSLRIFDMLGREVATVLDSRMSSGSHSVSFNASDLSSGVYLYRIEATSAGGHSFTQSRKMTLIK